MSFSILSSRRPRLRGSPRPGRPLPPPARSVPSLSRLSRALRVGLQGSLFSLSFSLCSLTGVSASLCVTSSSYLPVSVSASVFLAVSCSGAWVSIAHLGSSPPARGSGTRRAPGGFRMQCGCSGWRAQARGTPRAERGQALECLAWDSVATELLF